jgi:penicillin amidase
MGRPIRATLPAMRCRFVSVVTLATLVAAAPASARVLRAEGILPPGQSGFVSAAGVADGTGSPHLYDQQPLYIGFKRKPLSFQDPNGAGESPKPGVKVVRDAFGVPSITASNDFDAWYGAGYAVAQDRLFELELFKRAASGRLAEIVGKEYLDDDLIARRDYYTPQELDSFLGAIPPELRARFDAYRDGINAWIAHVRQNPLDMPGEFAAVGATLTDWTVRDSLGIGILLGRTVPSSDGAELRNLQGIQESGAKVLDELLPLRLRDQVSTIKGSEGFFPQGKPLTTRGERLARGRSLAFAGRLPKTTPKMAEAVAAKSSIDPGRLGQIGGSYMFTVREKGNRALLFNGPQLGFAAPELFVELEVHRPGLDVRGVTAPGVPVIGLGRNNDIAWGITSGLSDDDDLYAEQLVAGQPEKYVFRGQERQMDCRNETFDYRSPPSSLTSVLKAPKVPEAGSVTERICRTQHGPVQQREGGVAYARRYAIWNREIETLTGLAGVNEAKNINEVEAAVRKLTWNENLMAADSQGNIGYWHPGLVQLKPRLYDERLPYPGTGEAEWPGLVDRTKMPGIINPKRGWLTNWNNVPSQGWTQGDGEATERLNGPFHRNAFLERQVIRLHRNPSYEGAEALLRRVGTTSQQRPLAITRRALGRARGGATGGAKVVLDTILHWDGSYDRTDDKGTTDPGLAAWEAFKKSASDIATAPLGPGAQLFGVKTTKSHVFDMQNTTSYALRTLAPNKGYRQAAEDAFATLVKKFGTDNPNAWRDKRAMYKFAIQGAQSPPPLPFFDRGTWEQLIEVGP